MRRRAWAAWAAFGLFVALAMVGRLIRHGPAERALNAASGAFLVACLLLAASLLPAVTRRVRMAPPLVGLWDAGSARSWWCDRCGRFSGRTAPCAGCGRSRPVSLVERRRARRAAASSKPKRPSVEAQPGRAGATSPEQSTARGRPGGRNPQERTTSAPVQKESRK